ncbi:MAG: response regulator, partial [bacterium]
LMDGYASTAAIRNLENETELPIIALTAHQGTKEVKKCTEAGCTAYLSKPIRKQKLLTVIHNYLEEPQTLKIQPTHFLDTC